MVLTVHVPSCADVPRAGMVIESFCPSVVMSGPIRNISPSGVTHSNFRCGPEGLSGSVDGSSGFVATAQTVSPRLNFVFGVVQSLANVSMLSGAYALLGEGGRTIIVMKMSMPRQASMAMKCLFGFRVG